MHRCKLHRFLVPSKQALTCTFLINGVATCDKCIHLDPPISDRPRQPRYRDRTKKQATLFPLTPTC